MFLIIIKKCCWFGKWLIMLRPNVSIDEIVDDLDLYTCSQKYMQEDLNLYISTEGDEVFNVCVVYEYSDEFPLLDAKFDNNDEAVGNIN